MPWNETTKMRERMRFVVDFEREFFSMTELCQRYGISRVTGYKWLERFEEGGLEGLKDRSRAPATCPHRTAAEVVELLAHARRRHPSRGPKKLIPYLARRYDHPWPAPSTAGEILKRLDLVKDRRRRRRIDHPSSPTTQATAPNQLWTADFKGQFKTQGAVYCYPLTVADSFSRYLLGCRALSSTKTLGTKSAFQRLFREYGLLEAIRTDNGTPFAAATAIGRLARLSVWWIRLGIRPELTQPSHPEQNGSHERMHRTLKAETTRPLAPIDPLSRGNSKASATSTTTNDPTNTSTRNHPPTSTPLLHGPIPIASQNPNTRAASKCAKSVRTAVSAGRKAGSTSATHCSSKTSDSKKSTTASGPSTSVPYSSADSTKTNSNSKEPDSIEKLSDLKRRETPKL